MFLIFWSTFCIACFVFKLCYFYKVVIFIFLVQIMFHVLQDLSSVKDLFIGHYYLINLNLKAERFEIMDSMRKDSDKSLDSDSSKIINSIKSIWATNYKQSNIKIQNFETIQIPIPKQLTTYVSSFLYSVHPSYLDVYLHCCMFLSDIHSYSS